MPRITTYRHPEFMPEMTARRRIPPVIDHTSARVTTPMNRIELVWRVEDQMHCVSEGYFFHRTYPDNHITVIPVGSRFENAQQVLDHLTQLAFNLDPWALRAWNFIRQQDIRCFNNAFDPTIRNYTRAMRWRSNLLATIERRKLMRVAKMKATILRRTSGGPCGVRECKEVSRSVQRTP